MSQEKMILDKLFAASENVPTKEVRIKRIDLTFTLKGLREDKIERLEQKYTEVKRERGRETRELNRARFQRALIAEATVAIGGDENVRWNHPALLEKYKASGAEAVIKKVLLAGEVTQLADVILELSGHYDVAEEVEELKNSSEDED
jgi:hypothetical protein